jgi:hypothetical protein
MKWNQYFESSSRNNFTVLHRNYRHSFWCVYIHNTRTSASCERSTYEGNPPKTILSDRNVKPILIQSGFYIVFLTVYTHPRWCVSIPWMMTLRYIFVSSILHVCDSHEVATPISSCVFVVSSIQCIALAQYTLLQVRATVPTENSTQSRNSSFK